MIAGLKVGGALQLLALDDCMLIFSAKGKSVTLHEVTEITVNRIDCDNEQWDIGNAAAGLTGFLGSALAHESG